MSFPSYVRGKLDENNNVRTQH